jgi:hypothetical protein
MLGLLLQCVSSAWDFPGHVDCQQAACQCLCCCPAGAKKLGHTVGEAPFFDTVRISVGDAAKVVAAAAAEGVNLRKLDDGTITVSLDETTKLADVDQLLRILNGGSAPGFSAESLAPEVRCPSTYCTAQHMCPSAGQVPNCAVTWSLHGARLCHSQHVFLVLPTEGSQLLLKPFAFSACLFAHVI